MESEAMYKAIFEATGTATMIIDEDNTIRMANRECLRVTGYGHEELVGTKWTRYVAPESLETMLEYHKARLGDSAKVPDQYDAKLINKEGQIRNAILQVVMVPGTKQSVVSIQDITERKRAEEALHTSQKLIEGIINAITVRVFWKDKNLVFMGCNAIFARDAGFAGPQDVIGKDDYQMVWRDQAELYRADDREVIDSGSSKLFIEEPQTTPEGDIITLLTSKVPLRDSRDEIIGVLGTYVDITERKRAEEKLRESEERLRITLEETQIGIMDWDLTNDIWYASPTYYTMLGYEPETGPADRSVWLDRFHPADRGEIEEKIRNVLNGDRSKYQYEARIKHSDGSYRWQSVLGHTIEWGKDGKPARLIAVRMDIDEHKQAEVALAESETRLRAIFEQSRDSIGVARAGMHVMVNPAYVRLFGYEDESELLGSSILALIAPGEREQVSAYIRMGREGASAPRVYETRGIRKDGTEFDMDVSASAYELDNEVYTLVILRDISEHKILEESLRQAQKMESIGRLAGGVAHDFNNLLTAVEGYIDLALRDLPDRGREQKNLLEARHSAERAANLTRQLLLFSRREPLQLKLINLNTIVRDLLKMLERLIGEQYSIVSSFDDDLPAVRADTGQIEQVLMNLMVNARDAMGGGGEIEIGTRKIQVDESYAKSHTGAHTGEFVRLTVRDNGSGMDTDTLAHIFEPFFSSKKKGLGTGLGLSVVYGIITQHGGWIDVLSKPGNGSSFCVFLPALPREVAEDVVEAVSGEAPQGLGEKILVVEDDESVRMLAERMLSDHNYTVVSAASAEEALEIFDKEDGDFRLIFSDVIMPGMNGIELIERLTACKPELRVMLASGFVEGVDFQEIRDRRYRFLDKPYALTDLLRQVRELLDEE